MRPNFGKILDKCVRRGTPGRQKAVALAVMVTVVLVFSAGCHSDPNVAKRKYLASGNKYNAEHEYRKAAIQYSNALKIDKNYADAHFALAGVYLRLGMPMAAYTELERTVELKPSDYPARIQLGNLLIAAGKLDAARAQAKAIMAAEPNNPDLHAMLSAIALKSGDRTTALKEIQTAIQLDPKRALFHENLGLIESGDPAQAAAVEAEFKKAIALAPANVQAHLLLAGFYASQKRWPEAEQAGQTAVKTAPKDIGARKELARIYFAEGKQEAGEQTLRQASQDLSNDPEGATLLANYYLATGQAAKARAEYARLSSAHPSDLSMQEGYVRALLADNDPAAAQTQVNGLMKKHGKDPKVIALNAIVMIQNGRASDAEASLQTAVQDSPKDPFLEYWLGRAALANGHDDLAEKSFLAAEQIDPNATVAENALAQLASQRGDLGLLLTTANKMITANPAGQRGYIWRAIAEFRYKQIDKAEADLNKAISLDPRAPEAYIELARVRFAEKKLPEGAALLEKALQSDPDSVAALRLLVAYDIYSKKPDSALARVMAQINLRPKNSGFYDLLAQLEMGGHQLGQAAAAAQKAMQLAPGDPQATMLYAQIEVQNGQAAAASKAWQNWVQAHPQDASAFAILGEIEESQGDFNAADADYRRALAIQSNQPLAANNLAYRLLEDGGNRDVALTLAQIARQSLPDSPETADTLAWAYYYKGIYGFAHDLLEQAVKTEPDNATMHYHLGMVDSKMRDKSEAQAELRKAISLAPKSPVAGQAKSALQGLS